MAAGLSKHPLVFSPVFGPVPAVSVLDITNPTSNCSPALFQHLLPSFLSAPRPVFTHLKSPWLGNNTNQQWRQWSQPLIVDNTDPEEQLVLANTLYYASSVYKPKTISIKSNAITHGLIIHHLCCSGKIKDIKGAHKWLEKIEERGIATTDLTRTALIQ
ncbi:uncharacterized protein PGTG_12389 [Puccinia graminis f. sp. tritici CRL 75-36-700-3]|uniref:Uncharacterized protein n=1 Tax=Puccinia graminis f. sp. tritici (strain CRL 75-36-700-3 / race SCCL) TaxID=418459 RepID=E3KQ58_PUCGT|nr:uncharacterized protein PGTG_12389 [Puccinia graminis f. sp. tritici CRL 75-36-700-3]EFP86433.1 hypothetical protein PGTG_12389 [Puccinia graminis f. sp. tritici CRL 75-36-700-3]